MKHQFLSVLFLAQNFDSFISVSLTPSVMSVYLTPHEWKYFQHSRLKAFSIFFWRLRPKSEDPALWQKFKTMPLCNTLRKWNFQLEQNNWKRHVHGKMTHRPLTNQCETSFRRNVSVRVGKESKNETSSVLKPVTTTRHYHMWFIFKSYEHESLTPVIQLHENRSRVTWGYLPRMP